MQEKVITYATPVFFALIALELFWAWLQWRRGRRRINYRLNDAISSIGLGVLSQIAGVFTRVLRIGIYVLVYNTVALTEWPMQAWWALPAAVVFYDFCYYWHHRWMHRIGIMWAAHVVHHSSEDYNLSTALRQTGSGALLGWVPFVPMAIAGVPPVLFGIAALIDLLYQFWIHTEHVGRLGWFDRVFASPSNHRVHHAVNDRYLDKNYGGIFIVWDRLFGTFEDERADEPVVYGTRAPLRSFNPVWANLAVYVQMARDAWFTRRWIDKLQVWVRPPGWRPADVEARFPKSVFRLEAMQRYDPGVPLAASLYALLQFVIVLIAAVHLLDVQRFTAPLETFAYLVYLTISLVGIGGVLEGRRLYVLVEVGRHLFVLLMLVGARMWFGVPTALPMAVLAPMIVVTLVSLAGSWIVARRLDSAPAPRQEPAV